MTSRPRDSGSSPTVPDDFERRERELDALADVARELARASDPGAILERIALHVHELLGCAVAGVVELGSGGDELVIRAVTADEGVAPRALSARFARRCTLLDQALKSGEPAILIGEPQLKSYTPLRALAEGLEVENAVVLPVAAAGREMGGLYALNASGGIQGDELNLLWSFAGLAGVALERASVDAAGIADLPRLRALSALLEQASAALDEPTLLRRSMEALQRAVTAERAELLTRDDARWRARFARGDLPALEEGNPTAGVHVEVVERGERIVLASEESGRARKTPPAGVRQPYAIAVPVPGRTETLGSILLARSRPYTAKELDLVTEAAGHIGVALERVRQFRRASNDAARLERSLAARTTLLQDARQHLSRSRSLASIGQIAAGVAHDLNNALNPIVSFADLIEREAEEPKRVREYVARIRMAARDGAETVQRIQQAARRRRSAASETIGLADVVQEAVELTRPSWAERKRGGPIEIVQAVDADLLVRGTAAELREALLNLITNALDAMPAGGVLRFVGEGQDGEVLLAVQDTGFGMPPEVLEKAIEPFFTTKGMRGTGLGLSEVYGIVRRQGGDLEIESWPGLGTTVLLRLPKATGAKATRRSTRPRRVLARATPPRRVLLVDDNVLGAEGMAAALRSAGHAVTAASSAEEALALFEQGKYDLVLTDLGLPGLSGWELVTALREQEPRLRVGVITGWPLEGEDDELKRRGVDLVLLKPVDPQDLLAAL